MGPEGAVNIYRRDIDFIADPRHAPPEKLTND
jgi:hypothetical protein